MAEPSRHERNARTATDVNVFGPRIEGFVLLDWSGRKRAIAQEPSSGTKLSSNVGRQHSQNSVTRSAATTDDQPRARDRADSSALASRGEAHPSRPRSSCGGEGALC